MKVSAGKSAAFIAKLPPDIRALLLFGPDAGLVRARAADVIGAIVDDPAHPFRVAMLPTERVRAEPGLVLDEVCALAFGGGRRVVNIRAAADDVAPACDAALRDGRGDSLLLVEAGDLPPRSKLRALFERATDAAAVPCYADSGPGLRVLADQVFAAHGLTADRDAHAVIAEYVGADHLLSRRELEKLALFCATEGRVTAESAAVALADAATISLDDLVNAVADGDTARLDRRIAQLWQDQVSSVAVLRAALRHFQRLLTVRLAVAGGATLDAALAALRPPVFWKHRDGFRHQAQRWQISGIQAATKRLLEAEIAVKSTGNPDRATTTRCFYTICQIARAQR